MNSLHFFFFFYSLIDSNPAKPVYGVPLKEHLRVTERTVALVIEACVCTLLDAGLEEEVRKVYASKNY